METSDFTWQRDDTQLPTDLDSTPVPEDRRVLILTIAAHPEVGRVGEVAVLSPLLDGFPVVLSRMSPAFFHLGGAARRPLQTNRLSRQPFHLIPGRDGRVTLERGLNQTSLCIDDREMADRQVLSDRDLERGVSLLLNGQVLLWLHFARPNLFGQSPLPRLIGDSEPMLRLRGEIRRAAEARVPVLIQGETGTGKELVARALHQAGPRKHAAFVAVNMAAVPPSLAASELFGASKGAYTGADRDKVGLFTKADGGTLFLDEIGDAAPETQALLLRALEEREIQPVGSVATKKVDVRIISATDADLLEQIRHQKFRSPLLHRLAGYRLQLPALRHRKEDIARLFFAFVQEDLSAGYWARLVQDDRDCWPPASIMTRLLAYPWPGNVRELRNIARRLAFSRTTEASAHDLHLSLDELLESGARLTPGGMSTTSSIDHDPEPQAGSSQRDWPPHISQTSRSEPGTDPPPVEAPVYRRRQFRKISDVDEQELLRALRAHGWVLKAAATELGVSRAGLYRLIDACPSIRKASEIPTLELEEALNAGHDDIQACAARLEVSPAGLKMRLKALRSRLSSDDQTS